MRRLKFIISSLTLLLRKLLQLSFATRLQKRLLKWRPTAASVAPSCAQKGRRNAIIGSKLRSIARWQFPPLNVVMEWNQEGDASAAAANNVILANSIRTSNFVKELSAIARDSYDDEDGSASIKWLCTGYPYLPPSAQCNGNSIFRNFYRAFY